MAEEKKKFTLMAACLEEDFELAVKLAEDPSQYVDVFRVDHEEYTPLIIAIKAKNVELVKKLLDREDVSISLPVNLDYSPSLFALNSNNKEIIDLFSERNPSLLLLACKKRFHGLVLCNRVICELTRRLAVDPHQDVNAVEKKYDHLSPILYAIKAEDTGLVKALLSRKEIDLSYRQQNDQQEHNVCPFAYAVSRYLSDILELLIGHKEASSRPLDWFFHGSLYHLAVHGDPNHPEYHKILLLINSVEGNPKEDFN